MNIVDIVTELQVGESRIYGSTPDKSNGFFFFSKPPD